MTIDSNRNKIPTIKNQKVHKASAEFTGKSRIKDTKSEVKREEPDFKPSGKLLEDTNQYNGVVIKYSQPPEAKKPNLHWRLYMFKANECLDTLYIHRHKAFLIGKDRRVVDIPTDHPSCSKQHAVIQYRKVKNRDDAIPYLIDLDSSNGTFLNGSKIDSSRYYELREKDVIKFGYSTREYVLMHDQLDTGKFGSENEDEINKEDLISD